MPDTNETIEPELQKVESEDVVSDTLVQAEEKEPATVDTNSKDLAQPLAIQRFWLWYAHHKKLSIPLTLLVVLGVVLAIPFTRYTVLSLFWQQSLTVAVIDSQTHTAVSEAAVTLGTKTVTTDRSGIASFSHVSLGPRTLTIEKTYYTSVTSTLQVPLFESNKQFEIPLVATGRPLALTTTDRITGKPLSNVLINAGAGSQVRSNDQGKATLIIPANKQAIAVNLTLNNYLNVTTTVHPGTLNDFSLTPTGQLYFLSKQSGKIDVVSTNFDGSNRQTIVAGVGTENDSDTSLLAARDWKYLVLKAQRAPDKSAGLYLIDTSNNKLTTIDTGGGDVTMIGWSDHRFLYDVSYTTPTYWQPKHESIKSFNAESRVVTTLDETDANGDGAYTAQYQSFANYYILDDALAYTKSWYGNFVSDDKQAEINTARPDGLAKRTLSTYSAKATAYIVAKLYEPQEILYQINSTTGSTPTYGKLENGKFSAGSDANFTPNYPTFLLSPDDSHTFWSESRDGRNFLFVGDKNAEAEEQVATSSEYAPYGWYGNYLLIQKGGSELYVTTKDQLKAGGTPLKVSDYHKAQTINGYGYGYGGL